MMAVNGGDKSSVPETNGNGDHDDSSLVDTSVLSNDGAAHDPYYPPVIALPPEVDTPTGEDGETEVFKMRSKLYRFDSVADPAEWKERGTGDVRILHHPDNGHYRLLMRREKTLKVCANHFVRPWMMLKPMKGSEKSWMWQVHADFAEEEMRSEVFAIRFGNPENAGKFKKCFDDAVIAVIESEARVINCQEEEADGEAIKTDEKADQQHASVQKKDADSAASAVTKDLKKLDLKK